MPILVFSGCVTSIRVAGQKLKDHGPRKPFHPQSKGRVYQRT